MIDQAIDVKSSRIALESVIEGMPENGGLSSNDAEGAAILLRELSNLLMGQPMKQCAIAILGLLHLLAEQTRTDFTVH